MYLDYFGLKETPFSIAPDPRYLYMSERHREALAHLLYGVSGQGGFIVLTGEVGTGKTTICRCFLNQIPKNTDVAFIINPKLSARELMASICDELSISYPESASIKVLNDLINDYLLDAHANNRHTVLIIDEAQNLRIDVLEQLRLLTNLETSEKKLLQIILLGQPELRDVLAKNELRQLAQRVTARYHLNELNQIEVGAYVNCRLAVAGRRGRLFEQKAIRKLYKLSKGVPRLINLICDRSLLGAYASQADMVEESHIRSAYQEIVGEQPRTNLLDRLSNKYLVVVLALALCVSIGGWFYASSNDQAFDVVKTMESEPTMPSGNTDNIDVVHQNQSDVDDASLATESTPVEVEQSLPSEHTLDNDRTIEQETSQSNRRSVAPILNSVNELSTGKDDKFFAFKSIFERWGVDYHSVPFMLACDYAEMYGLRCLHKTGNWRSVLKLNRPAVLTLINESGAYVYLALLAVEGEDALVAHGNEKYWISLNEIDSYWLGEYSIVWKLPPYKSNFILPGQLNEEDWLQSNIQRVIGRSASGRDLESLIKLFQKEVGLVPDGIAGSMTLIHINSQVENSVPHLMGGR